MGPGRYRDRPARSLGSLDRSRRSGASTPSGVGMTASNYDKFPVISVPDSRGAAWRGWPEIAARLRSDVEQRAPVVAIECYPGVFQAEIGDAVRANWPDAELIDMHQALLPESDISKLVAPFTGGDDPIFGFISNLSL